MHIIDKKGGLTISLPAKELKGNQIKALSSALAQRILEHLSVKPDYPRSIATALRSNEQNIYYHIRNLEAAGIITVSSTQVIWGANANLYTLAQPAFVIRFTALEETASLSIDESSLLEPFIQAGKLNATIIVGSPDPHGPQKARSRDGYYAIDLALFLGTYLQSVPRLNVRLDTEVRPDELQNNLIIIGGPIVNTISQRINKTLPIRFDEKDNLNIHSRLSGNVYRSEEAGIIVRAKNPFNQKRQVLVIAGKRHQGTRAAIIAFLKHSKEVFKASAQEKNIARVVEGLDLDSDGLVDDVEFLE